MPNIYSNIINFNSNSTKKIIKILSKNGIIGLPTETVYGLAANAYSETAIKKVYSAKKRIKRNPLIIHYYDLNRAKKDVILDNKFYKLYKKFSPGPITYIVKKKKNSKIKSIASANLKTVGIRFPKNKIIRKILKKIRFPLAMPSANKSSSISPVSAEDVSDEFKNRIKVVDGGYSKIGIESTVLNLVGSTCILRPGKITTGDVENVLGQKIKISYNGKIIKSPGMLKKHYSPNIPILLNQKKCPKKFAFITFGSKYPVTRNSFNLSKKSNLNEAAKKLYMYFRIIKNKGYKKIYVARIPTRGIGKAINDRLNRAAK
jgi:L-threonylcarbamoyladenylate synthase|tara:strand:- start:6396 stop:7346 length:951 start_codon:yes stop_codon:yes gene_type:complete